MKKLRFIFGFLLAGLMFMSGCHFISSFSEEPDVNIQLSFNKSKASISMGAMEVINLKASSSQNSADIKWSYDDRIILAKTDNYSAVITGLAAGTTTITARCGSNSASCIVTVSEETYAVKVTNPYVYASADYVDVTPGNTVKVSAALFGGTVADNNGFTWTLDNPSVASISTEANYCWITGQTDGIAKLTLKHNKAAYPFNILVNCSTDGTTTSYITTTDNIITINMSEERTATFSVDLMNPSYAEYASGFTYRIVDSLGNDIDTKPVVISGAGGLDVSLTAYEEGECYVRCSHPNAHYDLDILVRVIKNAETVYIEPSKTIATVTDTGFEEITVKLANCTEEAEPSKFSWNFSDNAEEYINYSVLNGDSETSGDRINIVGKKTGSVKITVSYPGIPSRDIIVLVRDVKTEASDALTYITTSQNYVRLSPDSSPVQVNVILTNSLGNDIEKLHWKITNLPKDGKSKVINYRSGTGTSSSVIETRNLSSSANGYCVIEPVSAGTAYIDISHPKALYPTRITVVVAENKSVDEDMTYLNLTGSPVIALQNGSSVDINIAMSGSGKSESIVWEKVGNVSIAGNGLTCNVSSPASGNGGSRSTVTAKYPETGSTVTFSVICYDTENEFNDYAVKSIYSYNTNARIFTGQNCTFCLETAGFTSAPSIAWKVSEGESCIDFSTENGNRNAIVTGKKAGKALLVASASGCDDVTFLIEVEDNRIINKSDSCYLSTSSNVLYFEKTGDSLDIEVKVNNIDSSSYSELKWTLSNGSFEVSPNGKRATVTALSNDAESVLTISHPLSENTLSVYLKSGKQYEYVNKDTAYISASSDVLDLFAGQEEVSLTASLNHTGQNDASEIIRGFSFRIEDESVASISYLNYSNICYVKPLKNGSTKIIISHPDADFEKEVIVIVNNAADATSLPYITTSTNVITVVQGNYVTASVQLMNSKSINNSLWHWTTGDSKIADVIANNGTSALLSANAPGTVEVKVTHDDCPYAMRLLVVVLDSSVVVDRPYISTSTNIITLRKGASTTLTAEMVGGNSESDNNYFRFTASNSSMIMLNSSSGAAYVKALNAGLAYITVYNSRYSSSYSKTVLVVIEDTQVDNVYIKTTQNIIKLKPEYSGITVINAELVNGEPTDGEDFIWWADDYNLVSMTAVAEQCSVMTTGRSGTTKIHVKHPKSEKQADIIVMVSDYDSFSFSNNSATINTDKLYFFPLHVPAMEEEYEIRYSSTNENVCIVSGSNSVAWVCGTGFGNASLTASMVAKDGTVIASAEMLVSVTVIDPILPVVSLADTILTVDAGTSRVISATLTGKDVEETEKYNLKWSVKDKKKGITILDETPDKTAYGSDIYVTFDYGGEYVLTCEHEASGVSTDLYIKVIEKGEMDIELSSNLETVFKDDGSFTLTAKLINGSDADTKNIEWSSLKIGGLAIVSVSKTKGATCTVSPKNVGQTEVIAKIPNGKTARCIVVVKANMEISLDLGSIHVIPGYTEVVNYKTNPENATINWFHTMTQASSESAGSMTNYFSYVDDTAKKQLRITGLRAYNNGAAGTISATMAGASSANVPSIKVYVNYDLELRLEDMKGNNLTKLQNNCPDTKNVKEFNIVLYPTDLDIDIKGSDGTIACLPCDDNEGLHKLNVTAAAQSKVSVGNVSRTLFTEEGVEKCRMTVTLVPHKETDMDITVTATLPMDMEGLTAESKSFYYEAYYENYDIEVVDLTASGAFTSFTHDQNGNVNNLILGDGEDAVFYFRIKNENAIGKIEKCEYKTSGSFSSNDYNHNSSWNKDRTKSRKEKARDLFNLSPSDELYLIEKQNLVASKGLLYFYEDNSTEENTRVWHLSHNWDYYKDLPSGVTDGKWNDYFRNFNNSFYDGLEVDYWLVSRELVYNGLYAIKHDGFPLLKPEWKRDTRKTKHKGRWGRRYYKYRDYVELKFNGISVFRVENGGSSSPIAIDSLDRYYKPCIPYVITTAELKSIEALVRPDFCSPIYFEETSGSFMGSGIGNYGGSADDTAHIQKHLSKYITPTVRKFDSEKEDGSSVILLGSGTIHIEYSLGRNVGKNNMTTSKDITVRIKKTLCEAYTNKEWKQSTVSGNKRWTIDDKLFDSSLLNGEQTYFTVLNTGFVYTTSELSRNSSLMSTEFEIYPADATVQVYVPKDSCIGLRNYTSRSESGDYHVYTVSSTSIGGNKAKGTLNFNYSRLGDDCLMVVAKGKNLDSSYLMNFEISSNDNFVAEFTETYPTVDGGVRDDVKKRDDVEGSYVSNSSRMIVLQDGETVCGTISNEDTSSITKIRNAWYQPLTSSTVPALDNTKDANGKKQTELVDANVQVTGNSSMSFRISHNKDYCYKNGYFRTYDNRLTTEQNSDCSAIAYSSGNVESWYVPKAGAPTGWWSSNTLSKYYYEKNAKAHESTTATTSCTVPYHYKDGEYIGEEDGGEMSYNLTPVGKIIVETDLMVPGETDGAIMYYQEEFLVFVRVSEANLYSYYYFDTSNAK